MPPASLLRRFRSLSVMSGSRGLIARRHLPAPNPRAIEKPPISSRLFYTAEYFRLGSYLLGLGVGLTSIATAVGYSPLRVELAAHPLRFALSLLLGGCTAVSWWWAGEELHEQRRLGGWLALGALVPPLLQRVLARGGGLGIGFFAGIVGVAAVLTSWRRLE